jgi:hypothetical protein
MPLSDDDYLADLRPPHLAGQLPAAPVAHGLEGTDVIHYSEEDNCQT